jgi:hypothetical protein
MRLLLWIGAKLLGLGKWLRGALRWITSSREHVLLAVIGALVIAVWGQHHHIAVRDRYIAALTIQRDNWRKAEEITRKSNERLTAALHEQNAAVEGLKVDADKRVLAGQAALSAAKDRAAVREGLAARIDAQRAPAGTGDDCRTSAAVMAAKGEL